MKQRAFVSLLCAAAHGNVVMAQTNDAGTPATLPAITVESASESNATLFNAIAPPAVNKSTIPLSETPQSITVVPRALLESQQAQSLGDALNNVPGVVSQTFGRRGWDDLIIRGQTASDSLFLDGLRTGASNRIAQELFGLERIEVVKGPASLLYGQVLPGGLVNMVSKRPGAEAFANADVTVGNFGLRQGTFDLNRPVSENGKAAFRVNGLMMNSDDATDHVYYRNRYIAPSLSLDLGPRTDFTILTSYQEREYLRQQGLPLLGSVKYSPNGQLPLSRFTGEPGQAPYKGYQTRVGYALTHRFDSGWTLNQNVRRQEGSVSGQLVSISGLSGTTLRRSATDQQFENVTTTLDTNIQRVFQTGFGKHEITLGSDYLHSSEDTKYKTCTVGTLNVYNPVYGSAITCPATYRTNSLSTVRSFGIYARDQIQIDRWRIVAGLRRDHASTYSDNYLNGSYQNNPANATTGSAAVMYEILPGVRPYVSYATSFSPNTGIDRQGQVFEPETGRQAEAGVKLEFDGGATAITVAAFDLRRRNVLQSDPADTNYSVAVGEQRTRGAELGFASDMRNGLSLFGGYAYTASQITEAGTGSDASTVGNALNNVPRHSFNVSSRYRFKNDLRGWDVTAGLRGEGKKFAYSYFIPGYIVGDIGVGYTAARWRAALNLKNVLDQRYYAGGLAAAVAVGNSRTVMLTLGYRY